MPMDSTRLAKRISDKVVASDASDEAKAAVLSLWSEIATAIIEEIKSSTITVEPGIPVVTVGTSLTQTGSTNGPGTAKIS